MFELQVRRDRRITFEELIEFLLGKNSYLEEKIFLEHNKEFWITDNDLYKAILLLQKQKNLLFRIAKLLEAVTIIPSKSISEEKKPMSFEELNYYTKKYLNFKEKKKKTRQTKE